MVNVVRVRFTVGVPERTPSAKFNPAGIDGWMPHVSTFPPVTVGWSVVIGMLRTNVKFSGL